MLDEVVPRSPVIRREGRHTGSSHQACRHSAVTEGEPEPAAVRDGGNTFARRASPSTEEKCEMTGESLLDSISADGKPDYVYYVHARNSAKYAAFI